MAVRRHADGTPMTTREKDAEEANEQDATIARLEDMIVPGSGERIASGETYDGPQCENCARLEAKVADLRSCKITLVQFSGELDKAQAEVAELKREFSEVVKLIPAGRVSVMVMKSWRERGLLEE